MKDQYIRLINVYILGPAIIRNARNEPNTLLKYGLAFAGLATIVYNGNNYNEERKRELLKQKVK